MKDIEKASLANKAIPSVRPEGTLASLSFPFEDWDIVWADDESVVLVTLKNPILTIIKGDRRDRMTFSYTVSLGRYHTIFADRNHDPGPLLQFEFKNTHGGSLWTSVNIHELDIRCTDDRKEKSHAEEITGQIYDDVDPIKGGGVQATSGAFYPCP
ncbi:hypothetical protein [Bacillus sp. TE8-1]|uniref:hypothetical protein n=1 Tax=Bacillus sp. TE8-1 TaxID=2217829 RepID=UPI0011EC85EA|nr:hypothetical protein [Bacillus sp. TE8-1]KAA0780906.1 hypothetical protein DN404_00245 [Bacillus sp. TE8-1]